VPPEAPGRGWAVADISLGLALSFSGDLAGAEAALRKGLRRLPGDGWAIPRAIGLGHLALVRLDQGDADEAEAITADAERHIAGSRIDEAPATSAAVLARGRLLELRTDLAAAGAERELAILRLLAGELSQREIGSQLYVSFNTVKSHTRSIFRKFGVTTRAAAVDRGRELGLL
jgi:LuxR family transcriptional regulator, maltose regulon positive regulatory protein